MFCKLVNKIATLILDIKNMSRAPTRALEKKVARAILELDDLGAKLTQSAVIKLIGGSFSSVGVIFKKLKEQYDNFVRLDDLAMDYNLEPCSGTKLVNELKKLRKQVTKLEELNTRLAASNAEFTEKRFQLESDKDKYYNLYKATISERKHILNSIRQAKDRQIASLLEEIKTTHKSYTKQLQDTSTKYEDKLIQAKVELINFKEKLNRQDSKLIQREQQAVPQQKLINNLQDENKTLVARIHELEQEVQAAKC